jgi:outer membrane murein-binding lipoprotein Lpp
MSKKVQKLNAQVKKQTKIHAKLHKAHTSLTAKLDKAAARVETLTAKLNSAAELEQ